MTVHYTCADPLLVAATCPGDEVVTAGGTTNLAHTVSDTAGNKTDVAFTVVIVRDPPMITCGVADSLWHATDVSIPCTAVDSAVGLADPADASFSLTTSVPAGTETANASTNSRTVANTVGLSSTAGPVSGSRIDKRAPSIVITAPPANGVYLLNQAVTAGYSCTDGGSGVATCAGPVATGARLDTASVGAKTFTVNATDQVGNASSATVAYSVGYQFAGFFRPVSNPPTVNNGQAGQDFLLKWKLTDANGAAVRNPATFRSLTYQKAACPGATGAPGPGAGGSGRPGRQLPWAGMRPVVLLAVVVAVAFVAYCLIDLARRPSPRNLPKAVWALIICVSVPLGGIVYLIVSHTVAAPADREVLDLPPPPAPGPPAPSATARSAAASAAVDRRPGGPPGHRTEGAIEVERLVKRFGATAAVDGLSFTVQPGRVTGFLGPNGAGKTTTMRLILGLNQPTAGRALVGGRPYREIARPLHEVGSLLDANAAHPGRRARLHLRALARSNGIGSRRVDEVLELTGLGPAADRRLKELSLGMKQRLGIAGALLGDPPVLLFDEPANGLDAEGIRWIRQLFRTLAAEGRTILVSSHLMSEMALTADHLVIIGRGRLLADTPTEAFVEANARRDVLVRSPRAAELAPLLTGAGGRVTPEADGGLAVAGLDAPAVAEVAFTAGVILHELTPRHASLEDAYLDLTRDSVEYRAGGPPTGAAQ